MQMIPAMQMCHLLTMRFEGKHLESRFLAQSARLRLNLCTSFATRNMFAFVFDIYFLQEIDMFKNIEVGLRANIYEK